MLKTGIIVGSTRPGRKAAAVAEWVYDIMKSRKDAEFEIVDIEDYKLPLLDEPVSPRVHQYTLLSLGLMGSSAVLLDVGVTGDQTLGRRAINLLQPEARGRINGLFVGLFFLGGAAGAAMAGIMWASGGWPMICATGAGFGIAALAVDCLSQGLA